MTELSAEDKAYYEDAIYYSGAGNPRKRSVSFLDTTPKPFIVQIPLVEYFERMTRLKADKWQHHFLGTLQAIAENRHVESSWDEFHAEPQLGKTRCLSQIYPAWLLGHDPLFRYVLAMYNSSRSEAHSDVVIQIMRSQLHRDIFPNPDGHLPRNASKEGWMTNARRDVEGGGMDAQKSFNPVGLESGMTGSGMDHLTIDDPYKQPKDAFSETMYQNLARFWEYGVKSRISPHTNIAAMFHRYSYDDFGGYLLNTGKFNYVRYATVADGSYVHEETGQKFEDPLGRREGEYVCPERRPPSYYTDKKDDDKVWLSMFQGRPGKEEGDFFKVGKIGIVQDVVQARAEWEQCYLRGRGWDHAATSGAGDWSAGGLGGIQADGSFIVSDMLMGQWDSATRIAKQQEMAALDGRDVTVIVPEELAASGKDVVFFTREHLQGFNVVARKVTNAEPGSTAKKRRAHNLSVAVNSGKVKFLAGEWNETLLRAMRRFGASTSFDDPIDALSDLYNWLYEEYSRGLVIKGFSDLQLWQDFAFGDVIPQHWMVYAALKITPEENLPNSGVIVARAAENSGLKDTLFILAEYKEYTADYEDLFEWLGDSLKQYCEERDDRSRNATIVWLHPDSALYAATIRRKLGVMVQVFDEGQTAGIVEANWYIQNGGLIGLIRDPEQLTVFNDDLGLAATRQEAATWGFTDKGEPNKLGQVWDCLRMVTRQFRTIAASLTESETYIRQVNELMPDHIRNDDTLTDQERAQKNLWAQRTYKELQQQKQQGSSQGRRAGHSIDAWRRAKTVR